MSIYKKRSRPQVYRRIYERHYGPIPKDDDGKSYHIHHIDGNPLNDEPSNLMALSVKEHYDLHYAQGDWYAALKLAAEMKLSRKEKSDIAKKHAAKQLEEGTHPFQNPELGRRACQAQLDAGTHPFQNPEINARRIRNGTHPLLGGEYQREQQLKLLVDGGHNSKIQVCCLVCRTTTDYINHMKYHGDKCKGTVQVNGQQFPTVRIAAATLSISEPSIHKGLRGKTGRVVWEAFYVNTKSVY